MKRYVIVRPSSAVQADEGSYVLAVPNQARHHFDDPQAAIAFVRAISVDMARKMEVHELAVIEAECYPSGDAMATVFDGKQVFQAMIFSRETFARDA